MRRLLTVLASAAVLVACTGLQPQPTEQQSAFLLAAAPGAPPPHPKTDLVIEVAAPRARAGFDTNQMAYTRRPDEIEYFSHNRWVAPPARMIAPALAQALEASGAFRAVVREPSAIRVDLRLDTELVRLQQDFSVRPSRVQLTMQVMLVRGNSLATAQFEEIESATSDDPYAGVIAANQALARLAGRIAEYCAAQALAP